MVGAGNAWAQSRVSVIPIDRPYEDEAWAAPDSTGYRKPLKMPLTGSAQKSQAINPRLPYPILFVHGLYSNSSTWNDFTDDLDISYGTVFGGRFDFCLNYDQNNSTANLQFAPNPNADIAMFNGTWNYGDYYYINFDVSVSGQFNPSGSSNVKSNQSAITKQGLAIREAVSRILQLTGKDKVILAGHSMGGLASREYIQNPAIWQPDGQHHIAKLMTTGTPHGGSNTGTIGLIYGPDGQSEAVRDLRRTYYFSGNQGVYLLGGIENLVYMEDQLAYYFYNSDVNCNGITGETIIGLNQKTISTDIAYSCVIGVCSGCPNGGDGVVSLYSASLNSFYSGLNAEFFNYNASSLTEIHTDLPKQEYENLQGLDEPDMFIHAYNVDIDSLYLGFITLQDANNSNYPLDYDIYKFDINDTVNISVDVDFISVSNLAAGIFDSTFTQVSNTYPSLGNAFLGFNESLLPGTYYLVIEANPTSTSYQDPYEFIISVCPKVNFVASDSIVCTGTPVIFTDLSNNNPAQWLWSAPGGNTQSSTNQNFTTSYANAGTYDVTLYASNTCGTDSLTQTSVIVVLDQPVAPTVLGSPTTQGVCQGTAVNASIIPGSGGLSCSETSVYSIDGGLSQIYTPGSQIGSNANSSISITASRSNCSPNSGCNAASQSVTWTVYPVPAKPSITQNGNVLTSSAAIGNQWYLNSNALSGETAQSINCAQYGNGNYSVQVKSVQNCLSEFSNQQGVSLLHSDKLDQNKNIRLYPNPSDGLCTLDLSDTATPFGVMVSIYTMKGERVWMQSFVPSTVIIQIDSQLPSGVYVVHCVLNDKESFKELLVVQ